MHENTHAVLQVSKKYEPMRSVIERCNALVLEILQASTLREAKIAAESFKNGGKRLRPALMILSSMAPKGMPIDTVSLPLIQLAAAVELIHLATLFHDDVIDEVETRRMQLSARAKYGNHASVLSGDYVLAEALLLVQQSGLSHTMPEFLRTISVLVRGESRETENKFNLNLSEAMYFEIISEKSASLFSLSCKVGGMSYESEFSDLLGHFGWNLGMAFQMIDDLDDMLERPTGNPDCDLRNGYVSLPVIRTLANLKDGHRESLVNVIRRAEFTVDDERYIVGLCNNEGSITHTNAEIHKHLDRAAESLNRFEQSEAPKLLETIVNDLKSYADMQVKGFAEFSEAGNKP
jgi:geranylgeranyl pyrophosphate synthase